MTSIHLLNVCKRYGPVHAVKDLTLLCEQGQMLALLGPSGCGKSSTLKMIAGIEPLSAGEIRFGERDVSQLAPGERNIAMVFEDYALYPHLSVAENIAFPLRLRRIARSDIRKRVEDAMRLLQLEPIRDENVKSLSGGAQQRVSIGRALVRDPDVILFDEPLSHLDADQKVHLRTEMKRLQQTQGLTSILVTHDQTEAIAMSDAIAVMNYGVLQQVGPPQALYERPANVFVAAFVGEPPMNLLPARVTEQAGRTALAGHGWTLELPPRLQQIVHSTDAPELIAGIRPEHMHLLPNGTAGAEQAVISGEVFFRELRGDADVLLVNPIGDRTDARAPGDRRLYAEVPGPTSLRQGDRVRLAFDAARLNLFEGVSGNNLLL